jgi:hypothetical protein
MASGYVIRFSWRLRNLIFAVREYCSRGFTTGAELGWDLVQQLSSSPSRVFDLHNRASAIMSSEDLF